MKLGMGISGPISLAMFKLWLLLEESGEGDIHLVGGNNATLTWELLFLRKF